MGFQVGCGRQASIIFRGGLPRTRGGGLRSPAAISRAPVGDAVGMTLLPPGSPDGSSRTGPRLLLSKASFAASFPEMRSWHSLMISLAATRSIQHRLFILRDGWLLQTAPVRVEARPSPRNIESSVGLRT